MIGSQSGFKATQNSIIVRGSCCPGQSFSRCIGACIKDGLYPTTDDQSQTCGVSQHLEAEGPCTECRTVFRWGLPCRTGSYRQRGEKQNKNKQTHRQIKTNKQNKTCKSTQHDSLFYKVTLPCKIISFWLFNIN